MMQARQIALAAVLVLGVALGAPGESVSVLLEKGIHQEEAVGDLDAAMGIYRKIVKDAEADRKYIAQARYRLGVCYLKKKQHGSAISAMEELIRLYPDQGKLIAKARKCMAAARGRMGGAELAKVVGEAVTVISTCSEGDPRVGKQLASLEGLNEAGVVQALKGSLGAEKNTVRRSAIYILWRGPLRDISPAVPALLKLCSHKEVPTRGMAALALGARKVAAGYPKLCEMALKDDSGYARRCAAYALGLLGKPEARDVLEKVLKDKDPLVRGNAEAALRMLAQGGAGAGAPKVIRSTPGNFANDVAPGRKTISVTFDRKMRDGCWAWVRRWPDKYPKTTGDPSYDAERTTCSQTVKLEPGKVYWIGINTPPYTSFMSVDGATARQHVLLFATRSADGKPTPIPDDLLRQAKAILASAGKPAPSVVATAPKALAEDVSASLTGITVTFDQAMMDGSWSWMQRSKETFPTKTGEPRYDAKRRTCTLPVRLQPGKVYWVGMNTGADKYFQTAGQRPARPYVLLFATRGRDGKPTPIPAPLRREAQAVNAAHGPAAPSDADKRAAENLAADGWRLWGQRKLAEAEEKFRQAVGKDPTNAHAWNGLGWAQQNQGKRADAKGSFGKCLALDPKQAGALNGLAWIAKMENRTAEALGYWKKAVEILPSATAALNGLTSTLMELGRHAEAVKYYEMWLKVEPDNAAAKAGLAKARKAVSSARSR